MFSASMKPREVLKPPLKGCLTSESLPEITHAAREGIVSGLLTLISDLGLLEAGVVPELASPAGEGTRLVPSRSVQSVSPVLVGS